VRELERLRTELSDRSRSVAVLKANLGKLGRQEEQLRTELTESQKRELALAERARQLESQLAEESAVKEALRVENVRLATAAERHAAELQGARLEVERLNAELSKARGDLAQRDTELAKMRAELERQRCELQQAGTEREGALLEHPPPEKPAVADRERPKLESAPPRDEPSTDPPPELDALKAMMEALTEKVAELEKALAQKQAVIVELRARGVERDHVVDKLTRELREARQREVAELEARQRPDRLTRIRGIGPSYERTLAAFGVTSIARVAEFTEADVNMVASKLKISRSRVQRWIQNAKELLQT
jgi:predicted flap endonuclease-1-like 5' DNA nuclease